MSALFNIESKHSKMSIEIFELPRINGFMGEGVGMMEVKDMSAIRGK